MRAPCPPQPSGGDFYDVIPVPNGFVAIVGDVSGKGIPAALLASLVQGMFYAQIATGATLLDAVQSVNAFVFARAPIEKYLTLVVLRYAQSTNDSANVEFINGGHVSPIVVRADSAIETIGDGDLPVGLIEAATFNPKQLNLGIGDRIVLMSDGISEAENVEGTQFGQNELARHLTPTSTVASLFSAMERFCVGTPQADDQTLLTISHT